MYHVGSGCWKWRADSTSSSAWFLAVQATSLAPAAPAGPVAYAAASSAQLPWMAIRPGNPSWGARRSGRWAPRGAVLPHLAKGASINNTGSETGIFGSPSLIDYSTTKGAIHAFTKALAAQLLPLGIRVNCVAPGAVWTPLNPADKAAKNVAEFSRDSDMKRPMQPEELSPAYVFVASPVTASYISRVILPIIGGPHG